MSEVELILDQTVTVDTVKVKKAPKSTTPTRVKDALELALKGFNIEENKRPWMATKSFKLITTIEQLDAWVDYVIGNTLAYRTNPLGELVPVVAVDTETTGLDVRIVKGQLNVDIAGVCLSADGVEGIYLPITHRDFYVNRIQAARSLQRLFDVSHLVFFNAKFDREILRLTMGINFRLWPHFEDVQIFNYLLDPKADVSDKKGSMTQGGLKHLSEKHLGLKQIALDSFTKVKVRKHNPETGKYGVKTVYAPFNLVPCDIALWYAAADSIVTWLLWELMHKRARAMTLPMEIDHQLVDTIAWMERQRYNVNRDHLRRTILWQQRKLEGLRQEMSQMVVDHLSSLPRPEVVPTEEDLEEIPEASPVEKLLQIVETEGFNPGSTQQLSLYLYGIKGFVPYKVSEKTGAPSTDSESLEELKRQSPSDPFLVKLFDYREYAALHPENLTFDPRDDSAKITLRQTSVAGGRLSANGGDFEKDGGCGLNIQAIKSVSGNKWAKARLLAEELEDIDPSTVPHVALEDVPSQFLADLDEEYPNPDYLEPLEDFNEEQLAATEKLNAGVPRTLTRKVKKVKFPNINNHLVSILGYTYCIVKDCPHCKANLTVLKESAKADTNEIVNLRSLFTAIPGWVFFTADYSNIEMRVAANISREPKFVTEFLEGEGDFHTLTAVAVFGDKFLLEEDKGKRKALRGIAKILNFALLYGGTEHTIYESLKKTMPDVTIQEAKLMVQAYWDSVPVFKSWVDGQSKVAKEELYTMTGSGRVIGFQSAMEADGIREPREDEDDAYREYMKARKKAREFNDLADELKAEGAPAYEVRDARARADRYHKISQSLWWDTATGVRNYCDYNKFLGKAGRLSMNIPLQGLAGDFMRMALNRIRIWIRQEQLEGVFRVHGSVHDEVDPSCRSEYAPYIIPRMNRCMKLRDLHEERGWPVPIETDIEFGQSWDIEYHLAGDKDHLPSAWYDMPGMTGYVPIDWYDDFHDNLKFMVDTPENRAKLSKGLRKAIHPKAHNAIDLLAAASTEAEGLKWLTITLQLDEFWRIDEGEEPCTLEEFEAFYGLTRDPVPVGGFLDPMPMELLEQFEEQRLKDIESEDLAYFSTVEAPTPEPKKKTKVQILVTDLGTATELAPEDDSPLAPEPKKKVKKEKAPDPLPPPVAPSYIPTDDSGMVTLEVPTHGVIQCLKFLTHDDLDRLKDLLGVGDETVVVAYEGEIYKITGVGTSTIPEGFAYPIVDLERINEVKRGPETAFDFTD